MIQIVCSNLWPIFLCFFLQTAKLFHYDIIISAYINSSHVYTIAYPYTFMVQLIHYFFKFVKFNIPWNCINLFAFLEFVSTPLNYGTTNSLLLKIFYRIYVYCRSFFLYCAIFSENQSIMHILEKVKRKL